MERLDDHEYASFREAYDNNLIIWYELDDEGVVAGLDADELFAALFDEEALEDFLLRIPPRYRRYLFKGERLAKSAKERGIVRSERHSEEYVYKGEKIKTSEGKYKIRTLLPKDIYDVIAVLPDISPEYMLQQIEDGVVHGLYKGKRLLSVAGEHYEGTITLFGSAEGFNDISGERALLEHTINRVLEGGRRAIIHVLDGEERLMRIVSELPFRKTELDCFWCTI